MAAALVAAERLSKAVRVRWQDGLAAQFSYVWLRDNSDRRPSLVHLDLNSTPSDLEHSINSLRVLWPAYHQSLYSSQFLRDHSTIRPRPALPPLHFSNRVLPRSCMQTTNDAVNWHSAMGSMDWDDRAMDFGTVWPHFDVVPRTIAVRPVLRLSATVYVVDAVEALERFADRNPRLFRFLLENPIEYKDGPFSAVHPIAAIVDGHILSTVFNNSLRSSEIAVVDELETFYSSLKAFHGICCELATRETIASGNALLIDNTRMLLGAPPEYARMLEIAVFQ